MAVDLAPGLPGDWLNGWLAAVGVTVLDPDLQLSWSEDAVPLARFDHPGRPPLAERVAGKLPHAEHLMSMVLAPLPRKVTSDEFRTAAEQSRRLADWSLGSSMTDLLADRKLKPSQPTHGPFDVGGPGTVGTLVERAAKCAELVAGDSIGRVGQTLAGTAKREERFGLGFDIRRIPAGVQPGAGHWVDPVVECLCFVALKLFPVRGNGFRAVQRGWIERASERGAFKWPVWSQPLDAWGIDALLDRFVSDSSGRSRTALNIVGAFQSVPYQPRGDQKAWGYGSERIA